MFMTPYSRTQVVLLLVLLVSFLELAPTHEYQVLEFYAGVGRVAAMSKYVGYRSCALDVEYGRERFDKQGKRSPMDINSDSGLVRLVSIAESFVFVLPSKGFYTGTNCFMYNNCFCRSWCFQSEIGNTPTTTLGVRSCRRSVGSCVLIHGTGQSWVHW